MNYCTILSTPLGLLRQEWQISTVHTKTWSKPQLLNMGRKLHAHISNSDINKNQLYSWSLQLISQEYLSP